VRELATPIPLQVGVIVARRSSDSLVDQTNVNLA
jgi:hypothetical protein